MKALTIAGLTLLLFALLFQCTPSTPIAGPSPPVQWVSTETPIATITPMHTKKPAPTDTSVPTYTAIPSATATAIPIPTTAPSPTSQPSDNMGILVVAIIDGDTIEVAIKGQNYRLRYIGINTPEADESGGPEATQMNAQLVKGQIVRLEKDISETDRYGRLLRYVYVGNLFVNAELVRLGYAQAATYPPDVAYADFFVQLEREAREAGRGLWAETVSPEPPVTAQWNCSGNLYNCGDFSSCQDVMSYWRACPGDPSKLDGDNDGQPCESLCR